MRPERHPEAVADLADVAWALTASMIGGSRLSPPRAASSSRVSAASHAVASRSARTRRTPAT